MNGFTVTLIKDTGLTVWRSKGDSHSDWTNLFRISIIFFSKCFSSPWLSMLFQIIVLGIVSLPTPFLSIHVINISTSTYTLHICPHFRIIRCIYMGLLHVCSLVQLLYVYLCIIVLNVIHTIRPIWHNSEPHICHIKSKLPLYPLVCIPALSLNLEWL